MDTVSYSNVHLKLLVLSIFKLLRFDACDTHVIPDEDSLVKTCQTSHHFYRPKFDANISKTMVRCYSFLGRNIRKTKTTKSTSTSKVQK